MTPIPLMIVGDGPQEATGLGRIARDLAGLIITSDLPVDLVQVGGVVPPVWPSWRHYPLDPQNDDWGAAQVEAYWRSLWGTTPGILWVIWDPSRLMTYVRGRLPVQVWSYPALDSANINQSLSGPAAQALQLADRVLAYGQFGAEIIGKVRGGPCAWLPHGLTLATYADEVTLEDDAYVRETLGPFFPRDALLVGCVATNQPRKDLALYCATLAELKRRGRKVYGWLHTDVLVKAWAIVQLVEDFGLRKQITVTGVDDSLSDRQLSLLYRACDVTIAPGLGEGFGYPIVESLAAGVPVVHGDFGGGACHVPRAEWRPPVRELRLESVYGFKRPVYRAEDFANAVETALAWRASAAQVAEATCRLSVAHLAWSKLWPAWQQWIAEGL